MTDNEISGPFSTEERIWTSMEMIGEMISIGLAGATEQADETLLSVSHVGVALSWKKQRQETVGEYTKYKEEDEEGKLDFIGKGFVLENAAVALTACVRKTGQFYKDMSTKEDAKALFCLAKECGAQHDECKN